ncbi:MAG: hypothetical protein ACRER1_07425 [Gammaproteobacteria bacterium]
MRLFDDQHGHRWEAATAFGSYGEVHLIFSRMDANELRTSTLKAATLREATQELEALTDTALREQLEKAEPWQG